LQVKGVITNPAAGMQVLFVASDGTAAYADVNATTGAFNLRVAKKKLLKSFAPGKKRTGTSIQLVTNGIYAGPFLLSAKGKKGFGRLAPTVKGKVNLGTATLQASGFVKLKKAVKSKLVDTKRSMRLKAGVPIGAGTFGATGKITKSATRSRGSVETIPAAVSGVGDDADTDGVPNVADVDMNGDGVLDAAQIDAAPTVIAGGALSADSVLEGRPTHTVSVIKILTSSPNATTNSNAFPGVTWPDLTTSLAQDLVIEISVIDEALRGLFCPGQSADAPLCAAAQAVAKITVDCRQLAYCSPTSDTKLVGSPNSNIDRQPLYAVLNADGLIELPRDGDGFRLSLRPGIKDKAMFVGDSFVVNFLDAAGNVLGSQVKVLTSSVASGPAFKQIGSTPITYPLTSSNTNPMKISADALNALELTFFRPQQLDPESTADTPALIDRGGLNYWVTLMTPDNQGYGCKSKYVTPTSASARLIAPADIPAETKIFDDDLTPAQGGTLVFTVNVNGCLTDPTNVGPPGPLPSPPAAGTPVRMEIGVQDGDSNKTDAKVYISAP